MGYMKQRVTLNSRSLSHCEIECCNNGLAIAGYTQLHFGLSTVANLPICFGRTDRNSLLETDIYSGVDRVCSWVLQDPLHKYRDITGEGVAVLSREYFGGVIKLPIPVVRVDVSVTDDQIRSVVVVRNCDIELLPEENARS